MDKRRFGIDLAKWEHSIFGLQELLICLTKSDSYPVVNTYRYIYRSVDGSVRCIPIMRHYFFLSSFDGLGTSQLLNHLFVSRRPEIKYFNIRFYI